MLCICCKIYFVTFVLLEVGCECLLQCEAAIRVDRTDSKCRTETKWLKTSLQFFCFDLYYNIL